jgi:hypothetical protein
VPLSYKLHQELAEKHSGAERWGYRAVHCGQIDMYGVLAKKKSGESKVKDEGHSVSLQKRTQKAIGLLRAAGVPKELDWVAAEGIQNYEEMGTPLTTAQVHPYQFTTSMVSGPEGTIWMVCFPHPQADSIQPNKHHPFLIECLANGV